MKKILFFLIIGVLLFAEIEIVQVRVIGFGKNKYEAVENALIRALQQVNGVSLSSARANIRVSLKNKFFLNKNKKVVLKSFTNTNISSTITKTKGSIKSYQIENIIEKNGGYEVIVIVEVAKYKSPGLNPRKRRSLAVMPFEYKQEYRIGDFRVNGKALSERITQLLVSKITQTRKFTVLDRQNSKYYQLEKQFLLSKDTDSVELARLGKRLGADYIIIGQIVDFAIETQKGSSLIGSMDDSEVFYVTISYRILNIPTQQIKWSNTFNIELHLPNIKRLEALIAYIGDKISQKLVDEIMFNIYPPRIVQIRDKNVIINMGGNVIHKGDIFDVYALGEKLYDPYTKEYLGRDEIKIGKINITKVLPKISYGQLIEGKAVKGAIVRPIEKIMDSNQVEDGSKEEDDMFRSIFR